ncbi:cytochrome P450 [Pisolithus marmoratus]|nr:cytochrome P450 [Pisolithus marmoratus]
MDAPSTLVRIYNACRHRVLSASIIDIAIGLATVWVLCVAIHTTGKKSRKTKLRGPKSPSLLFGVGRELFESSDMGAMFEAWSKEYGVAYEIPMLCGQRRTVLCDPKAVAHLLAKDTWSYVIIPGLKAIIAKRFGRDHVPIPDYCISRQRRSIASSFNSTALRKLSTVIYKSVERARTAWEASIDANGGGSVVLDVQKWHVVYNTLETVHLILLSLDTFGIAGFTYDFGSLDGKPNAMISVLDAIGAALPRSFISIAVSLLAFLFPILMDVPTKQNKIFEELHDRMSEICDTLINNATKDTDDQVSTIGLLLKAEDDDSSQHITREEMRTLVLASYETTATAMTWALIELARHPDIQTKLRQELLSLGGEPSYDQLINDLPYLDAILQETLRVHPPVPELVRQADEDDVIPLSEPVRTKSGEVVDSIAVERGTVITIPVSCLNQAEAIWGPDARVFRPERWLEADGITKKAQELKGHRHLLTFGDGPRICLGKLFAIVEIKTVLWVVIKNFVLEMRDGPNTKVEITRGLTLRPRIAGEDGIKVPLKVRQYKG